ncbi:hypothetical protein BDV32DRAFT_115054 [Aspergillus pseudonomiae]|nr:hypothetical protein BDV32DRAFT_115054 [Aspergillus pseudonomiae]
MGSMVGSVSSLDSVHQYVSTRNARHRGLSVTRFQTLIIIFNASFRRSEIVGRLCAGWYL